MKVTLKQLLNILLLSSLLISAESKYMNGIVIDSKTLIGISDVNLYVPDLKIGTSTLSDGSFSLKIKNQDDMKLFISHIAYISKTMPLNINNNEIIITLDENFFISEDIVVTGTRSNKIYKNSPIATEIISKRDIENSGALNVNDLLLTQSGISESPSVYGAYDINIQGMDSKNILFLIDGQPITGKFYNRVSLDQISTANIEKIEITKGPSSSLYGNSSMGGTINIITKAFNKNSINWAINYTSPKTSNNKFTDGTIKYLFGVNKIINKLFFSINTDAEKIFSKKIIKESDIDEINKYSINTKTKWKINIFNDLKFNSFHYLHEETGTSPLINTNTKIKRNNISINHTYMKNNNWNFDQLFNYQYYDRNYLEKWMLGENAGENATNDFSREYSHEYEFSLTKKININELNWGMELSEINYKNNRVNNSNLDLQAGSIYCQYDMTIKNNFNLVLGLRMDKYSNFNLEYSPRIAIMHTFNRWKFRTSIGKGFRTPSFMERFLDYDHTNTFGYKVIGNNSLLPEKSFGGTLGVEYLNPNSYQLSMLIHYTKFIDHIIENYLGIIDEFPTYTYHNINNTYGGLEIRGKWKASSKISTSWEINFIDNRDGNGNLIPNTAPLTICNGYDYKSPKHPIGLTINTKLTQSYKPAYHDINNNGWIYDDKNRDAFIIVDIFGNYNINNFFKINFGFKNFTNYTNSDYGPFIGKTLFIKLQSQIFQEK